MTIEDLLSHILRDSSSPKFAHVQKVCQIAIDLLKREASLSQTPVYELRERCLEVFQLSLESHSNKLSSHAVNGIQLLLRDERFQSSMESERESRWLPMQVLNTVWSLPSLGEEAQVEIMKVLLNMSFTTVWCMNAKVLIKISQLCFETLLGGAKHESRKACVNTLTQSLGVFYQRQLIRQQSQTKNTQQDQVLVDTYPCSSVNVRSASKATITQMLASFAEKLSYSEDQWSDDDPDDILADFKAKDESAGAVESIRQDIVSILRFLITRLSSSWQGNAQNKLVIPLLLEGIHAVLHNVPSSLGEFQEFSDLVWQELCPSLIGLLGNPMAESTLCQKSGGQVDRGRGSGSSSSAPALSGQASRMLYSLSVELVRLVGGRYSLRPVLESLFHRMLLFPPAHYRHEAIKAVKQIVGNVDLVLTLVIPFLDDPSENEKYPGGYKADIGLLKLMIDSLQECCHCDDSAVCITSVECINLLLRGLEQLCVGECLDSDITERILKLKLHIYQQIGEGQRLSVGDLPVPVIKIEPATADAKSAIKDNEVRSKGEVKLMEFSPSSLVESDSDEQDEELPALDKEELTTLDKEELTVLSKEELTTLDKEELTVLSKEELTAVDVSVDPHPNKCILQADGSLVMSRMMNDISDDDLDETSDDSSFQNQNVHEAMQNQLDEERQLQIRRRAEMLKPKFEDFERESAKDFCKVLSNFLHVLLKDYSVQDVDESLVKFASTFCQKLCSQQSWEDSVDQSHVILNADGVYMATVSALWLNLKLSLAGFYSDSSNESSVPPISEDCFVDSVLGTGLLLFLSPTWLSELYRLVITTDFITEAGFTPEIDRSADQPLINFLTDMDGLGSHDQGRQLLCSEQPEESPVIPQSTNRRHIEAGKLFSRFILTSCWDGILDVMSVLLNGDNSCGISNSLGLMLGIEGAKEESLRAREAVCTSLEGLQKAARLCCSLGLQGRCGSVFALLANTSCVMNDVIQISQADRKTHKAPVLPGKPKLVRLHAAHVLSMDVIMTMGLEMGSHSEDCWSQVFRCCAHISELEHKYFSGGNNQTGLPKVLPGQLMEREADFMTSPLMQAVPVAVAPKINVAELIKQGGVEGGLDSALSGGGVMSAAQTAKALCGLSQEVDKLFEDAAYRLNLGALLGFLGELCEASQGQLSKNRPCEDGFEGMPISTLPTNAVHLYRLQDVMMRLLHSRRPLLHLLRAWTVVSPYLAEAAGHSDRNISKMAVSCIHGYITAMVSNSPELPHFHVNELLCKTLETLLCLDLCDGDVQDQVVCSICELVEACTAEIRSGWRPLFAALRAVKIEYTTNEEVNEARQRHVTAVLDVFDVFLATDNVHVFANATVDCILCLLKYVRGPGEFQVDLDDDSDSGSYVGGNEPGSDENLSEPALKYLQKCCQILSSMWKIPACPTFSGAHRIHTGRTPALVNPTIPNIDFEDFKSAFNHEGVEERVMLEGHSTERPAWGIDYSEGQEDETDDKNTEDTDKIITENHSKKLTKALMNLDELDNPTGILHVWFLVLEGLASAIAVCPKSYQPQTLEMLFELLRSAANVPGPEFALYCVNHLVLPMLQSWLRRSTKLYGYWEGPVANFKQCCGLCTDLVVEFIILFADNVSVSVLLDLMLKQLLDVLTECVALPVEVISRLGCSCIRHLLLSGGPLLSETMWQITARGMDRAIDVTTYRVRQLMLLFKANSENFYGDIGQVKVATRKDSTVMECQRLRRLAQQVFLLDNQISGVAQMSYDTEKDKSYVFLLYPPGCESSLNPDDIFTRVPFQSVVVGLLSHQLLLQTLGCVLLQGSTQPGLQGHIQTQLSPTHSRQNCPKKTNDMSGFLSYMSLRNALKLLDSLHCSYRVALDFDRRPGLKFLVQKVANTDMAANLYKQAVTSMTYYISALVEICQNCEEISIDKTRNLLNKECTISGESILKGKIEKNCDIFFHYLRCACDDISQTYIELVLDKEGTSTMDRMAEKPLFFLMAQPDDLPEFNHEKKWKAILEEKLKQREIQAQSAFSEPTPLEDQPKPLDFEEDQAHSFLDGDDPSESPVRTKSKRESRAEKESKVYTVASDQTIRSLITQYKRRKQQNSMPNIIKGGNKLKPEEKSIDQRIEEEQHTSAMKDSQAHLKAWSELLVTTLKLFQYLSDEKFLALLPTVFNAVNLLICRAEDGALREAMGEWFARVGRLLHLAPNKAPDTPEVPVTSPNNVDR